MFRACSDQSFFGVAPGRNQDQWAAARARQVRFTPMRTGGGPNHLIGSTCPVRPARSMPPRCGPEKDSEQLPTVFDGPRSDLFRVRCKARRAAHGSSMGRRRHAADRPKKSLPCGLIRNRAIWRPLGLYGDQPTRGEVSRQRIPIPDQCGQSEIVSKHFPGPLLKPHLAAASKDLWVRSKTT